MATVTSIVQTVVVVTAGPSSSPTPTQAQTPHSTTRASRPRTSTSAASTPSTVKGNDIPIHDKDTPVLSTPLIIVISIIACIVTLSALGFIWCWARRKPRRPVPIVEHAGVSYWNAPFQHDHSQRFDDDKELQTDDTSSLSPPTRALESRSGASTPTQGLLRALDSPASFLKPLPLPTTSEHASTVSLHSAASSGDRTISNVPPPPQDSRYSDFPNPAGTDSPIRPRGGFGHTHSTSRHSMTSAGHYGSVQSSHHGHHSVQSSSHHGHYVRSASRQSYFVDPTVHSGPTPVRHTSIRAAPHKAGIQIVLPQPLAPAVQSYATSTSSLVSNGNDQPMPIDRSPRRHSSQALMMHAAHGGRESPYANGMPSSYRPRERSRRQTSEVSPLGQSTSFEQFNHPHAYVPPTAYPPSPSGHSLSPSGPVSSTSLNTGSSSSPSSKSSPLLEPSPSASTNASIPLESPQDQSEKDESSAKTVESVESADTERPHDVKATA